MPVTRDRAQALSTSDPLAAMEGGRVPQVGSPTGDCARPHCRSEAEFCGESGA